MVWAVLESPNIWTKKCRCEWTLTYLTIAVEKQWFWPLLLKKAVSEYEHCYNSVQQCIWCYCYWQRHCVYLISKHCYRVKAMSVSEHCSNWKRQCIWTPTAIIENGSDHSEHCYGIRQCVLDPDRCILCCQSYSVLRSLFLHESRRCSPTSCCDIKMFFKQRTLHPANRWSLLYKRCFLASG